MAYSKDLRVRFIKAVNKGGSARGQARLFEIAASTGVKWMQAYRADGREEAKPHRGGRRSPLKAHAEWLDGRVTAEPDITLKELCMELAEKKGLVTSISAVSRFLIGLGYSFKKNRIRERARTVRRGAGAQSLAQSPAGS
jgi:transposase